MTNSRIIQILIIIALLIPGALAIDTYTLDPGTSTDWTLWLLSGLIGLILFLFSLNAATSPVEVEIDAIMSVMAWIPIGFCAYASFNVSRVIGIGTVTLYSMGYIGMIMMAFLVIAVGNTIRIVLLHRIFTGGEKKPT